ncbi:MAG: hypothetical protein Q7R72_01625 [bacterium]|nr:hypothetical protein [bacterium]
MEKRKRRRLFRDGIIVVISVLVAWALAESPFIDRFIFSLDGFYILNSFVVGLFFTSAFTTAPAIVFIAKLAHIYPPYVLALVGGLGALVGDFIIFNFIKGHISEDVSYLFSKAKSKRIKHLFEFRFVRWSMAFLGALIIASPFPDELGLTLMGLSKISPMRFALISYTFNTIGIFVIASIARAV